MKNRYLTFGLLFVSLLLSGCVAKKSILFSEDLRKKIESYDIDIKAIQFYNSKKIILERNLSYEEAKVASGKIRFEKGQYLERILIKKETPGICLETDASSLNISFESGQNRVLTFVRNPGNYYQLSAEKWEKKYGKIPYDTATYFIYPGGEKAFLSVKKEDIFRFKKHERVASGQSVSSN